MAPLEELSLVWRLARSRPSACCCFEPEIQRLVTTPLSQNQWDALVCFTYNLGAANLESSTLRCMLNAGDYAGAAEQFPRRNKAGGKVLPSVVRRRAAERELFLGAA